MGPTLQPSTSTSPCSCTTTSIRPGESSGLLRGCGRGAAGTKARVAELEALVRELQDGRSPNEIVSRAESPGDREE